MPLDYKYAERKESAPGSFLRKLFVLFVLLLLLSAGIYGAFYFQTRKANEWILTGENEKAEKTLNRWKWLPLVSGRVYEKLGTTELLGTGASGAAPFFQKSESKWFFQPVAIWQEVLKVLWTNGRYGDGLAYSDHLQKKLHEEKILHFYEAGFYAGLNQLEQASRSLAAAGSISKFSKEISVLKSEIEQRAAMGQYTLLYDRENLPLVSISLKGEPKFLYEPLRPVLQNPSGDYLARLKENPNSQATLTINYRIQNAALKSIGKYAGAMVVLNVKTGEILAAASNPKGIGSDYPSETSLALNTYFEPGSIIKMITLSGALEKGVDLGKIFPLKCEGYLKLSEDKILYDWKVHGDVPDLSVATAESCNVSFARIGLSTKPADLLANLKQFGFDARLQNAFLPFDLGRIVPADLTDHYLSSLSIGLEFLQMTPLHAAMLASSIANKGVCMTPRLLLHYRNIIGIPFAMPASATYRQFMSEKTAQIITDAMQQVVQHPEGTGRRAAIPNFPFALKTGTAGEVSKGYNALLIGFGPVPNPKIAFAIFIEHCGKAEFEGARITKLFLESIQGYI